MEEQVLSNTTTVAGSSNGNDQTNQTQAQTQAAQTRSPPESTLIYGTPSRTVRSNWIYYLRTSWRRISRTSKVILGTTLLIGIVQIVITIVILIIGKNEICDKPLDVYLIILLVRLGFSLPLTLYQYFRPSGPSGERNQSILSATSQEEASVPSSTGTTSASQNRSSSITSTSPNTDGLEDTPSLGTNSSMSAPNVPASSPYLPIRMQSNWLDRFKSLLDLISILWFVVGNYMIFTASEQCHRDAKYLFYTTMTWILLGYFLVLIPLLLCVAVVFCLPCLLVAMRVFNVDYATGMVGANKNEIEAIPVYKYKSSTDDPRRHLSATSSACLPTTSSSRPSLSTCSSTEKNQHGIMSHFISFHNKHRNDDDEESGFQEWTMDPIDASCTICLSDYENGDLVCRLRCNHHFHKDCVHEWLSLNYKCPLCQRDFRTDKANGGDGEYNNGD